MPEWQDLQSKARLAPRGGAAAHCTLLRWACQEPGVFHCVTYVTDYNGLRATIRDRSWVDYNHESSREPRR